MLSSGQKLYSFCAPELTSLAFYYVFKKSTALIATIKFHQNYSSHAPGNLKAQNRRSFTGTGLLHIVLQLPLALLSQASQPRQN